MKVAILANDRFPIAPPFVGGLESFTWHLARGLRQRGIEVVLFAAPGSDAALECEELPVARFPLSEDARGDIAMPPEGQVAATVAYANAMRTLASRPDIHVVHNNSLHYLPIVLASSIPQPVITTLHTPPHPWLEPALRLTPHARTVAVSHWVAHRWSAFTDAHVIHNGVDPLVWPPGHGGDGLVWTGRITPEKAPHRAAQIARNAGRRLSIAGPIIDGAYFRTWLEPLLGEDVVYEGHLGPDTLPALVGSAAACLVTPHWDEPFGLVAAEAMACGTPVLALSRGGLPEIVRAPGGECVSPTATDTEITAALTRVIALDRTAVRRHAEATCGLEAMIDHYVALYEELA